MSMNNNSSKLRRTLSGMLIFSAALSVPLGVWLPNQADAARARVAGRGPATEGDTEESRMEYRANDMINRGLDLIRAKQEERGLKLMQSVPEMFPKSKARFRANLEIGKVYVTQRQYDLAVKQFNYVSESEEPEEAAEGLYQIGICYFSMNNYDKAFMSLRKVTSDYPWSVFANESYYYIGQCHFKLSRWSKAIEALEMVGTSVPGNQEGATFAEAGQRLYVKVYDKDLVVQTSTNQKVAVNLIATSGDKEVVTLDPLGRSGEYMIGSVPTTPGKAQPGDGQLQLIGRDSVTVTYTDHNTETGKLNQDILGKVEFVSTASIGFTDGAFREYTKGIFGDQESFMRVKDLDRDTTDQADKITVRVRAEFKAEKKEEDEKKGVDLSAINDSGEEEEKWTERDAIDVTLVETGEHTGIFTGAMIPRVVNDVASLTAGDDKLTVLKGDEVVLEYKDEFNMVSRDPRPVEYRVRLLIGQIQDVKIEQRVVDSIELKSRKNLIEAKIFLKLGQIFKEVGLTNKANEKADEGLSRADDVISASFKGLDRAIVEDAFSVKWDLLLIQDKLGEAIAVCRTLTQLFPDSSLVDRALLKIGEAKAVSDKPHEAIEVFNSIISLPKSDLKPEAQYQIGVTLEKIAFRDAEIHNREPNISSAILAYKRCAETYPESPFAGDSLDKIANYYITAKDYARAVELMERVFQDYPDASFLDKMLLKWVIASYRMGNFQVAKEKAEQLLSEYPNSKQAEKSKQFLDAINKKIGGSAAGPT